MSSDSSGQSNTDGVQKQKTTLKSKNLHSSGESVNTRPSRDSKQSQNSNKSTSHPKITVLEQLSNKATSAVNIIHIEEPHKRTATTHDSTAPTVITAVLRDLHDDIIHSSNHLQPGPIGIMNGDRAIAVIGGDNVYVQTKSKFIPVPREKALSSHLDDSFWARQASKVEGNSLLDVAVMAQKICTPISSVCFGLLGGVALLQLLLVRLVVGGLQDEDLKFFLESYSRIAELIPLLFYILLAVCIISVLDRIPVEKEAVFRQSSWVVLALYGLTLIVSLSCASYDDLFVLYPHNRTLFQDQMRTRELLSDWQLLNSLRCLLALLGWVLFSLTAPPDLVLQHLLHIKQYEHKSPPSASPLGNSIHP